MTAPNPNIPPVRAFTDGEPPAYATLAEIRTEMIGIDALIVAALARRAECVRQAALFKKDPDESMAPEQQKININNAVGLAEQQNSKLPDFSGLVRDIYQTLVPGFVARQRQVLDQTFLKDERHRD